nr:hypothetical protein [Tanacetum cinerariifolium]
MSSGKSVHSEELCHNVEDPSKHQDQEHVIGETNKQLDDREATKADWFKKPERPPTPNFDWTKRLTRLKIKRKYDYGCLEGIKVRQDDQQIYTFKEGDFSRLRLQDIEDMLLLLTQRRLTNLTSKRNRLMRTDELHKFSDGRLNNVHTALHDIDARLRMEYLPMQKWSQLDRKRAQVMVYNIDRQLFQRRLMRNLEKFVGGRPYWEDFSC